jgi:predicted enzyme related to lactoylglutathione lyase
MEIESYEHGVPSWVDLGTPDPAGAAAFYSALFGWDVQVGPPETGGYAIAHLRGRAVAGIGPQQNPGPPVWSTYVNVVDADEIAGKVAPAGGELFTEPFDVTDVGRMAFFADPTGAVIGMWQARAHKGAAIVNEPGTYSWSELVTTDVDGAKDFYAAVFGWASDTHGPPTGPGGYTEFKVGDRSIAGMMEKPPEMPAEVPPFWSVYFTVDGTDAAMARAVELGGAQVTPAMDIEPGRFAVLADPGGAKFAVITPKEGLGSS